MAGGLCYVSREGVEHDSVLEYGVGVGSRRELVRG